VTDTPCGTATPHCPKGEVEHVIAKQDWNQNKQKERENKNTSWNSFEIHLRDVDAKRQTETER